MNELLGLVRLEGLAKRYPSQLSGGQLQRMALARALAPEPKVLLLDEPFGALDVQVRGELREWLRRLHEEIHVTTIFVTHDQEEAMDVAGQIVVMNGGSDRADGHPARAVRAPAQRVRDVVHRAGQSPRRRAPAATRHPDPVPHPDGSTVEALVRRVVHLGFEVRVELVLPDGRDIWAQVTRETARSLSWPRGRSSPPAYPPPACSPSGSSRLPLRA